MFANADPDSDFLCAVQGFVGFGEYAECTFPVDKRFSRDGSIFYIADSDGGDNVDTTIYAIGT